MKFKLKIALLIAATIMLSACGKKTRDMVPIGEVSIENPAKVATIREGSMLMRGLDGKRIEFSEIPNPFSDYVYAVKPGRHTLLLKNIQGGHPLMLDGLRCYVITVDLEPGVSYYIDEDQDSVRAVIRYGKTGDWITTGPLVDKKEAYSGACDWSKPPIPVVPQ